MTIKFMLIDAQAEFRSLLAHHITTNWPDAIVAEYDPATAGQLPDEFAGAGNDVILLGDDLAGREGIKVVKQFLKRPGFPAVVYFGQAGEQDTATEAGVEGFFVRDKIGHDALMVCLSDVLVARRRLSYTGTLFVGDLKTGISPLIKGYRFVKKLGATGHSAVYLAEKESEGIHVVLKVLRQVPDETDSVGAFDRFLQEYEMIAEMDHPNIAKIFDLGVGDDHAHIVMEYLDGGDLKERIADGITELEAVSYLRQIASALAKIHEVGILHRDLKPGNIMLRSDGSIALIDFGLAKRMRLEMEITDSGEIFGTPYYMSPEQGHAGDVDTRSDVYSLGVIFYELLTGDKPYKASSAMGIIYMHANASVPLLPQRLAQYQALLNMMLAKKPENRLQSAAEIEGWL